jgi:uncharacterized protein YbaR (Trm112 family)
MPLNPELLEILACPLCKVKVELIRDETGKEVGLKCRTCDRVYPIRDEIPVMLPDEARIDKSA